MPRPKGLSKTGGRIKGTPNKNTLDLQEKLLSSGVDVVIELTKLLPELPPELRVNTLLELMQYLYPKRKALEHKIEEQPNKVNFVTWGPEQICEALFIARQYKMNEPIPANWRDIYYSLRVQGNDKPGNDIFWDVWNECRKQIGPSNSLV